MKINPMLIKTKTNLIFWFEFNYLIAPPKAETEHVAEEVGLLEG